MTKYIFSFFLLVIVIGSISSCKKKTADTFDCSAAYTYSTDIKPIMEASCATPGCHGNGAKQGGFDLSNYNGCKAAKDRLDGAVQHLSGYAPMPDGAPKLSDANIQKISCWVKNGCLQ